MTVPAPNATPTINPDECVRLGRKVNYNNVIPQLKGGKMQARPQVVAHHTASDPPADISRQEG